MKTIRTILALAAVLAALAVSHLGAQSSPPPPRTAFVNVNVLPLHTNVVHPNYTVVVSGDRIVAVGPSTAVTAPAGATVIDGRGKYLMPGLAEMHGHIPPPTSSAQFIEDVLFLYVANGVTTVRGMQGAPGQLALRDRAARGEIVAPTLYLAGPALSGNTARTPDDAIRMVREQKKEGWDLLKVQTGLSLETYDAMVKTAHEVSIRASGHVPAAVGVERAMAGQETIDHMDGFAELLNGQTAPVSDAAILDLATRIRRSGVWVAPTVLVWETLRGAVTLESRTSCPELKYLPRAQVEQWTTALGNRLKNPQFNADGARHYIENRQRILKALDTAGARLLLGSDAPQQFNVPGFSVHREMKAMVAAGMSPYAVLRSGTASVGDHYRQQDSFGSIAIGHRADVLLVDANPLADVANAARRSGVMVRGRWIPEADIQTRLAAIARGHAQAPRVFEPSLQTPANLSAWTLDGSGSWQVRDGMLVLSKAGTLGGPVRRPAALAVLNTPPLTRVTLELDVRSEEPVDLAVRDVNLVVGWQSPQRFYYIHLSARVDDVHNGIFLVADADRKRLDKPTSKPQLPDQAWRRVKVERDPVTGRIAVFVDGATAPALEANDTTLTSGRIGVGSFDETGQFRNIVVTGYLE